MLAFVDHVETIDSAFGAFMIHAYFDVMARNRRSEIDRSRLVTCFGSQFGAGRGDMKSFGPFALQTVMADARAVCQLKIDNCVRQIGAVSRAGVRLDDGGLAVRLGMNDHSRQSRRSSAVLRFGDKQQV